MWWFVLVDPASACSVLCAEPLGSSALVQPADGAVDVPIDARPVVATWDEAGALLLDPEGLEVPAVLEPVEGEREAFRLVPEHELLPDTTYRVYAPTSDVNLGSFTTGSGRVSDDNPAPALVDAVGEVHFDLIPGHGLGAMCGGLGEGVTITPSWTATTGLYEVRATRENGESYTHLVAAESTALGWTVPCVDTVPDLRPREYLTIEVRSVDLLGRAGQWSEPLVASARAEEPAGCVTGGGPAGSLVLVGLSLGGLLRRAHRARA